MAFRLNKSEAIQHQELINELRAKQEAFAAAKNTEGGSEKIKEALAEFLVTLNSVEEFREEIASEMRDQYDEKSEKWQESDAAAAADEFISEWENADFNEPDLEFEDLSEIELDDYAQTLEDLPTED